jgi:hypothetical protein
VDGAKAVRTRYEAKKREKIAERNARNGQRTKANRKRTVQLPQTHPKTELGYHSSSREVVRLPLCERMIERYVDDEIGTGTIAAQTVDILVRDHGGEGEKVILRCT